MIKRTILTGVLIVSLQATFASVLDPSFCVDHQSRKEGRQQYYGYYIFNKKLEEEVQVLLDGKDYRDNDKRCRFLSKLSRIRCATTVLGEPKRIAISKDAIYFKKLKNAEKLMHFYSTLFDLIFSTDHSCFEDIEVFACPKGGLDKPINLKESLFCNVGIEEAIRIRDQFKLSHIRYDSRSYSDFILSSAVLDEKKLTVIDVIDKYIEDQRRMKETYTPSPTHSK